MMPVPAGAERSDHLARAVTSLAVVMEGACVTQRHADEIAPRGLVRLADRLRHLARLAVAEADATLEVADDDEGGKAEALAAFHDLGDAIDVHELVGELALDLLPVALAAAVSR